MTLLCRESAYCRSIVEIEEFREMRDGLRLRVNGQHSDHLSARSGLGWMQWVM
jgi:hypothetical protein